MIQMKKAQVSLEAVIIVLVALSLLLLGTLIVIQQSSASKQLSESGNALAEANRIADVLSRVSSSKNISEERISVLTTSVSTTFQIQRTEGKPGQVTVSTPSATSYANYFGKIKKRIDATTTIPDTTGFSVIADYDVSKPAGSDFVELKPVCGDAFCDPNEKCSGGQPAGDNIYCNTQLHRLCYTGACSNGCVYTALNNQPDPGYCDATHFAGECPQGSECTCKSGVCKKAGGQ